MNKILETKKIRQIMILVWPHWPVQVMTQQNFQSHGRLFYLAVSTGRVLFRRARQLPPVELKVRQTQLWKEQGQEKVSPALCSGTPRLFCPPAGVFGHATSISSHRDQSAECG